MSRSPVSSWPSLTFSPCLGEASSDAHEQTRIDRRTFAASVSLLGMGLVGCGSESAPPLAPTAPDPGPPHPPPEPQPPYVTALDRAKGVADGLIQAASRSEQGLRWAVTRNGVASYPTDLYTGQAGVLTFLAQVHALYPSPELAEALEAGGRWLLNQGLSSSSALYEGNAGRAWAFLSLHEVLGSDETDWLQQVQLLAATAEQPGGLPGDLINGTAGQGLFFLRLHRATGDERWLATARALADAMLETRVEVGGGIKFPSFDMGGGRRAFYTGMSHGSAGAGYFLCRLAEVLPEAEAAPYLDAARLVSTWLQEIARPQAAGGTNWYRREPDQLDREQVQWCHGAPGIGIFHLELHRVTGEDAYLGVARQCAAFVQARGGEHTLSVQCHGVAGNAGLFIKFYRLDGDPRWLELAKTFGEIVWERRFKETYYPEWPAGDGTNVSQPSLMTGNAGIGWLYLQLAENGALGGPVTD